MAHCGGQKLLISAEFAGRGLLQLQHRQRGMDIGANLAEHLPHSRGQHFRLPLPLLALGWLEIVPINVRSQDQAVASEPAGEVHHRPAAALDVEHLAELQAGGRGESLAPVAAQQFVRPAALVVAVTATNRAWVPLAAGCTAIRLQQLHQELGGPAPRELVLCPATLDAAILPADTPRHGLSDADYGHPVAERRAAAAGRCTPWRSRGTLKDGCRRLQRVDSQARSTGLTVAMAKAPWTGCQKLV